MTIITLLATGFEEAEAVVPADILKRAGLSAKFASIDGSEYVCGAHGISLRADTSINNLDKSEMDCLLLPGGLFGTKALRASHHVIDLIRYCHENGIYVGAICAAPSILGEMGLLRGKKCTCFPGYEKYFKEALLVQNKAVRDDIFITGRSAGSAYEYGFLLVETLCGREAAQKIRREMIY